MLRKLFFASIISFFLIANIGCASAIYKTAKIPQACDHYLNKFGTHQFIGAWFYWSLGLTLQQGDCTILPEFGFTAGDFYYRNSSHLEYGMAKDIENIDERTKLFELSIIYGCVSDESRTLFYKELIRNQKQIFNHVGFFYGRQVMIEIENMIWTNKELRNQCLYYSPLTPLYKR